MGIDSYVSDIYAAVCHSDDDRVFNTLPKELDEAVMIDGGSRFKALWKILVPTSVPGLVSVGMYTFMQAWNEYLFALALTKTNNMLRYR